MPSTDLPPIEPTNQPEPANQDARKEVFSTLARVYNEGLEQGGMEEGLRRLRHKLDEVSPRPYLVREPLLDHIIQGA